MKDQKKSERMKIAWEQRRAAGYISPNRGRAKPSMRGENHPFYKDGVRRPEGRVEYMEWQRSVLERDNYTCVMCGATESLQTDHIKPYWKYSELRLEVDNGRTLCKRCHEQYGYQLFRDPDFKATHSERVKKAWRDGKIKPPTEETRKKISQTLKGRKPTKETLEKVSLGVRRAYAEGRKKPLTAPHSPEHNKKISESLRRTWAEGRRKST